MIGRLVASIALSAAVIASPSPSAVADPCPDIDLVFARGTGEPPGMGRVGDALAATLAPLLGARSLGTYAVDYAANRNFLNTGAGADDARNHIAWMVSACPNTRIVVGGFSQGAAVVSMLAGVPPVGDRVGSIGSAPPLAPDLADHVAAVAVFGNPAARFGSPLTSTGQFGDRAIDLCSQGDPICSAGRDRSAHSSYELPPYPGQAAAFIAGLV